MADSQGAPFLASSQSRIGEPEDATSQEAKQTIDAPRTVGLHALPNRPTGPGLERTSRWSKMELKDITDLDSTKDRKIEIKSDICACRI
ncbi:hypothetical protein EMCG_05277 [[Emmonsia] crescens]|uniref:Uncharacterized protein n=1 Tax=[Emmonsia] crescens TaxID=73230 RepID=A0A0G2J6B7_9EURO|nr:hypothetical protein EMCG_05277 [Emmonsia crescens UAMH 3008]